MKKPRKAGNGGFTLVELLVCLLITVLIGVTVTTAIVGGIKVYNGMSFVSESEILADTVNVGLSELLRYSGNTELDGERVLFDNANLGIIRGSITEENGRLVYYFVDGEASKAELLNASLYSGMKIQNFTVTYDAASGCYRGSYDIIGEDPAIQRVTKTFSYKNLY